MLLDIQQLAFDAVGGVGRLFVLSAGSRRALTMLGKFGRELGGLIGLGGKLLLFAGAVVLEPGVDDLLVGELLLKFSELFVAGAQFTAPREQTGRSLPRADH